MLKQRNRGASKSASGKLLNTAKSFSLHPVDNRQVVEHFYEALDTPLSLSCYLMYKYGENDQLVSKEILPSQYNDAEKFRDDFAAISFMRKHETLKTSFAKSERAISVFLDTESACKSTNQRIKSYLATGNLPSGCEYLLNVAIRKIDRILGRFSIDELLDSCGWGPGVTTAVKGCDTSASQKFDHERSTTRDLYHLFSEVCCQAYPLWDAWKNPHFEVGNVVITVPKNAKVDRTIAIEPGLNSWIQKGLGSCIRRRLRKAGYNLNSDLKNQRGAFLGSLGKPIATVDFKAASDTISIELVRLLLPPDWFNVLDAARSKYYVLNDQPYPSSKFSTMGNGFTFELESLIFLVLGLACCEKQQVSDENVSIFGDDLIVPSTVVPELSVVCDFLGFQINHLKSYSDGYFRESCGSYYFNGQDVKPVFFRRDLKTTKSLYRFLNTIRWFSHVRNGNFGCDKNFRGLWSLTLHKLPQQLRLFGPISAGDAAIHENGDTARVPKDGHCGWLYSGLPEVPLVVIKESLGLLLQRLYSPSKDRADNNSIPLRARTKIVFKRSMFTSQWYELGPWI